jgi:hypothetical protein
MNSSKTPWIKGERLPLIATVGERTTLIADEEPKEHGKPDEKPKELENREKLDWFDPEGYDWGRFHYEGKRFEARSVCRGEFEALRRFGAYEVLGDGTLMRMEGDHEFRIHCDDSGKFPYGRFTPGFCSMLGETYDRMRQEELEAKAQGNGEGKPGE